jgi:hypothetical protein
MPYIPPNTFTTGQPIEAGDVKGNDDALKVYLHESVVTGDLRATPWVQTRHIQAPVLEPMTGIQHGVSGIQGSQWDGGALVRCQFVSAMLTGKRYGASAETFEIIPQTTFSIGLRQTATVLFHWWMESNNGPDNGTRSFGANAYMWVCEYNAGGALAGTGVKSITQIHALEAVNNSEGFTLAGNPPSGPDYPYTLLGYGNMSGTKLYSGTDNLAVGLAGLSLIDRSAIINWGVYIEAYYLM